MIRGARSYFLYGLGFFVVLELMLGAAVYFWPTFEENISELRIFAAPVPMLGTMLDQIEKGGVAAYVAGQHYFKGCNTLGMAAAILFAAGAVAGEAHRGTLELWLARPVSRWRLLTERYVAGLLAVAIPVFATTATVPWMLSWVDETMHWDDLMRCALHMSIFLIAAYSVSFLWSSAGTDPMRISFSLILLSVFEFALYMVKTVTNWSLFRLVDVEVFMKLIIEDRLNPFILLPLIGVSVACYLLALRMFARRVP